MPQEYPSIKEAPVSVRRILMYMYNQYTEIGKGLITVKEAANAIQSSYQNARILIQKMRNSGFIDTETDEPRAINGNTGRPFKTYFLTPKAIAALESEIGLNQQRKIHWGNRDYTVQEFFTPDEMGVTPCSREFYASQDLRKQLLIVLVMYYGYLIDPKAVNDETFLTRLPKEYFEEMQAQTSFLQGVVRDYLLSLDIAQRAMIPQDFTG